MSNQRAIVKNFNIAASNKAWYPTPSADLTGTLTSTGRTIIGTGTLFLTELSLGDYLLDSANDDLQKVLAIENNTKLTLESEMTTPLAGATCKRIKSNQIRQIQIVAAGTGPITIRGVGQATSGGGTWPVAAVYRVVEDGGLDPILVTVPSSTTAHISTIE